MKLFAGAQHWLAAHHTQALVAGGAGVAGFALYKRRQNGGADPAAPAAVDTGSGDVGAAYGDPGTAGSTLSDVDAALLDADLTGIAGTLDGIKTTLGKMVPAKVKKTGKKATKRAKRPAGKKAPKRKKPAITKGPGGLGGVSSPLRRAPRTKADQQRRTTKAARKQMTALPTKTAAPAAARRVVNNPRPVTSTHPRTPVVAPKSQARTLAKLGPKPAKASAAKKAAQHR